MNSFFKQMLAKNVEDFSIVSSNVNKKKEQRVRQEIFW